MILKNLFLFNNYINNDENNNENNNDKNEILLTLIKTYNFVKYYLYFCKNRNDIIKDHRIKKNLV